jgi:hypothetical protein
MLRFLGWLLVLVGGYGLYRGGFAVFEYFRTAFYAGSSATALSFDAIYGFISIFVVAAGALFLFKSR